MARHHDSGIGRGTLDDPATFAGDLMGNLSDELYALILDQVEGSEKAAFEEAYKAARNAYDDTAHDPTSTALTVFYERSIMYGCRMFEGGMRLGAALESLRRTVRDDLGPKRPTTQGAPIDDR